MKYKNDFSTFVMWNVHSNFRRKGNKKKNAGKRNWREDSICTTDYRILKQHQQLI